MLNVNILSNSMLLMLKFLKVINILCGLLMVICYHVWLEKFHNRRNGDLINFWSVSEQTEWPLKDTETSRVKSTPHIKKTYNKDLPWGPDFHPFRSMVRRFWDNGKFSFSHCAQCYFNGSCCFVLLKLFYYLLFDNFRSSILKKWFSNEWPQNDLDASKVKRTPRNLAIGWM